MKLPEPKLFTVERLANRWKVDIRDVLDYGISQDLKIYILMSYDMHNPCPEEFEPLFQVSHTDL